MNATNRTALNALDTLGLALAEHHHQWTPGEREAYESVVDELSRTATDS